MLLTNFKKLFIDGVELKELYANNIQIWRAVTSRIPSEYQEVEYIHAQQDAYINTRWIPAEGSTFNIKFSPSTKKSSYVFGCGSNPRLAIECMPSGISNIYNTANYGGGIYTYTDFVKNTVYDVETYSTDGLDSYVKVNGSITKNNAAQYTNFDISLPMLIGAWNYSASNIRKGAAKIYYVKANVAGTDIFELIPCYRKSDGVAGMYDTINKSFLTNAGSEELRIPYNQVSGNLADPSSEDWQDGYRTASSGISESGDHCVTNYIGNGECLVKKRIYYKNIIMAQQRLNFYDKNKNMVYQAFPSAWSDKQGFDDTSTEGYITIDLVNAKLENAYYVRLCGLTDYTEPIIKIDEEIK